MEAYELQEIELDQVNNIIETRLPIGRFYCYDDKKDLWLSIDNSSGDAFIEEHDDQINCVAYLELYT